MNTSSNKNYSILILATKGWSTNLVFNTISNFSGNTQLILEEKVSSKLLLKNRIRNIGVLKTIGQLFFIVIIPPIQKLFSGKRIKEIIAQYNIDLKEVPIEVIHNVVSVNSDQTIKKINQLKPDLIIVNGTRIISKKTLEQITAPIINIHTGITPQYRGVHGGYWALYNNDKHNFGTTIHYVDKGIDTGKIIGQYFIEPKKNDNFSTYPLLQYSIIKNEIIKLILSVLNENNEIATEKINKRGELYYHPTFISYIKGFFFRSIK